MGPPADGPSGGFPVWQAVALGALHGPAELLPISSSGHLILVPWIADWHYLEAHPDFNKTFDVALHLGTLVAVVAYFWADVTLYVGAWFRSVARRRVETLDERVAWWIFFATIPAALAGAVGESAIEDHLGQPWQIAIFLSLFAGLLWVADRSAQNRRIENLGFWPTFLIGTSQILALMPGVSRSGITITTGRFLRLERDAAARFAFLLLIPIVFGAVVFKGLKDVVLTPLPAGSVGPFVVGTLAATAVGRGRGVRAGGGQAQCGQFRLDGGGQAADDRLQLAGRDLAGAPAAVRVAGEPDPAARG